MPNLNVEDRTCECGFVAKTKAGLTAHVRKHAEASPPPSVPSRGEPKAPPSVTFHSPKAMQLRLIMSPSVWEKVESPAGTQMLMHPGKVIEFERGVYRTSDPEEIAFLRKYDDARFPIVCLADFR